MSLASYTLLMMIIAVSNAILGFGGAMLLGLGPRVPEVKLQLSWRQWFAAISQFFRARVQRPHSQTPHAPETPLPASEPLPSLTLTPIHFTDNASPKEAERGEAEATLEVEEDLLSLDAALAQLSMEVAAVRSELCELDERVRNCTAAPTVDSVEECVADLKQTGHRLYEQQTQAIAAAHEIRADGVIADAASSEAHAFIEQQTEQLRQSLEQIDGWEVDPNKLDDDCRRLLAATEQLMQSCDEVGHAIEEATTTTEHADPARPKAIVTEPHAIPHESIHSVARMERG